VAELTVYRAKEAESFDTPEGTMTPLFVNEQLSIFRVSIPAGLAVPPHSHKSNSVAILLKGRLELTVGDERKIVEENDVFFIPSNLVVGVSNSFQTTAEILAISYPSSYKSVEELKERLKSLAVRKNAEAR
jgi:quercetin dioxygenase-like cupin family protein